MTFSSVTVAEWRALVDKDLGGKSFEKALVHETLEGIPIAPLYAEAPRLPRVLGDGAPFRICMRHDEGATTADVVEDLGGGGADGLWLARGAATALPERIAPHVLVLRDVGDDSCMVGDLRTALVSTIAGHDAGADAAEEIALALSTCVLRIDEGARALLLRVAVGRDTFMELCKLRALRICVGKVLAAYGDASVAAPPVHAVCSSRTLAARDPWVNMLRVTTQVFSAVLGGADLVTPLAFDRLLERPSAVGRRLARNTGHVLREESALGRVIDPGAGSYFFDTLTDALAREGWARFRAVEREGGMVKHVETGRMAARIEATRRARRDPIARRRAPRPLRLGVREPGRDAPQPSARERGRRALSRRRRVRGMPRARRNGSARGPARHAQATGGIPPPRRVRRELLRRRGHAHPRGSRRRARPHRLPLWHRRALRRGSRGTRAGAQGRGVPSRRPSRGKAGRARRRPAGVDAFLFVGCDAIAVLVSLLERP